MDMVRTPELFPRIHISAFLHRSTYVTGLFRSLLGNLIPGGEMRGKTSFSSLLLILFCVHILEEENLSSIDEVTRKHCCSSFKPTSLTSCPCFLARSTSGGSTKVVYLDTLSSCPFLYSSCRESAKYCPPVPTTLAASAFFLSQIVLLLLPTDTSRFWYNRVLNPPLEPIYLSESWSFLHPDPRNALKFVTGPREPISEDSGC